MSGKNNGASGRARSGARRILYGTLAASLVVHLGLVAVVNGWLRVPPAPLPERMEVRLQEARPPSPPDSAREIVELPPGPESETAPPEDARFRAERNSRVEQETAARDRRAAAQVADQAGAAGSPAPTRIAPPKPEPPAPTEPLPPSPDAERKSREQVALLPNLQALSRMMGAPAPDRLRGVTEGDRTRLNAFLDPDAVFFNRLKRLVAQEWVPLVNAAPRPPNPTGEEREWVTEVLFVLDRNGEVVTARVLRSSGLEALDESAVGAFRQVGRIPNPPARLLDDRGYLASVFTFSATERYQHVEWGRRPR